MKKTLLILSALSFFALTFSCKKENLNPEYPFTIKVESLSDTVPVGNILVEVFAPVPDNSATFIGFTSEDGKVSFKYDKDAVFLVRATRGKQPDFTYIGCTEVRLEPDEEVFKTVYLVPYDRDAEGCSFDF